MKKIIENAALNTTGIPNAQFQPPLLISDFSGSSGADFGAEFSDDRKYRFALWRIWDRTKPLIMFIGLNPSTANELENDKEWRLLNILERN